MFPRFTGEVLTVQNGCGYRLRSDLKSRSVDTAVQSCSRSRLYCDQRIRLKDTFSINITTCILYYIMHDNVMTFLSEIILSFK